MSTDTLEFPEIKDAQAQPRTEVATAAVAALDLMKVDLTDVALAQFGKWRTEVVKVKENLRTLVLDLSTQAKIDEAKSLRHRLIGVPRAEVRKVSKDLKSKLAKVSKAIGAEEDAAVVAFDDAETLITPQIEARQAALDAEKEAARQAEAERKSRHEAGIAKVRAYLTHCQQPGMTAARIQAGIDMLRAATFGPEWEEFAVPAANAQCETLEAMQRLHADAVAREEAAARAAEEAARIEAQRVENERIAAELEAKRIADEAAAAERQRVLDEQAADLKRQADELAAQQAAAEARELEAAQARAAAQAAAEAASDAAQHAAGQAVNPGACAEAAPSTLQPVPGGTPATTSEANDDDESDRGCARRLAGEGDDCGPGQPGERDNDGRDDGSAEHGAGLLRALAPRTAHQGDADHADLNTTSGAAPLQAGVQLLRDELDIARAGYSHEADAVPGGTHVFARDIYPGLGYVRWENFDTLIQRCDQLIRNGLSDGEIEPCKRSVSIGSGAVRVIEDYRLDAKAHEMVQLLAGSFKLTGHHLARNETGILSLVAKWARSRSLQVEPQKRVGRHVVDLVVEDIGIEFDEPHHADGRQAAKDETKTAECMAAGFSICRFGLASDAVDVIIEVQRRLDKEMVLRTDQPTPIADSAAAADIANRVILVMDPEDEDDEGGIDANDLRMRSLEFVRGFLTAFAGKYPTQPKESPEWWAKRRAEAEALLPRLIATTGRSN